VTRHQSDYLAARGRRRDKRHGKRIFSLRCARWHLIATRHRKSRGTAYRSRISGARIVRRTIFAAAHARINTRLARGTVFSPRIMHARGITQRRREPRILLPASQMAYKHQKWRMKAISRRDVASLPLARDRPHKAWR